MAKRLTNDKANGLHVKMDNLPELYAALKRLARDEVLVGYPEATTQRDDPESQAHGITNASLAYIHDNGAPEARIPARPFMIPGIEKMLDKIENTLAKMARYALKGEPEKIDEGFQRIGLLGVQGIQSAIRAGVPPPLAESTLKARARKGRKGAQSELDRRDRGLAPGMRGATPLMDTNEMLKSTNYVVRPRSARRS